MCLPRRPLTPLRKDHLTATSGMQRRAPVHLSSPHSARVKSVAQLARRSAARRQQGLFHVEGLNAVEAAVRYRGERVTQLYVTEEHAQHDERGVVQSAAERGIQLATVTEAVMRAMTSATTPPGILALCEFVHAPLQDVLTNSTHSALVLGYIRDPGNCGTVIRAADAAGVDAVVISADSVDVYNPKVVRSTAGSLFSTALSVGESLETILWRCDELGIATWATDPHGVQALDEVDCSLAHAWVLGNEAWGLPEHVMDQCRGRVTIPVHGRAESLNVAMAATLCAYASARGRSSRGVPTGG